MYLKHLSTLQFVTYASFFAVVVTALFRFLPGKQPPLRLEPYTNAELGAHDRKLAKYFVAAGFFLVLGSVHMVVKNVPWIAERLARMGYAGHLVRDRGPPLPGRCLRPGSAGSPSPGSSAGRSRAKGSPSAPSGSRRSA